jgi:hypothetical protein
MSGGTVHSAGASASATRPTSAGLSPPGVSPCGQGHAIVVLWSPMDIVLHSCIAPALLHGIPLARLLRRPCDSRP